jgi:hypothetical protein
MEFPSSTKSTIITSYEQEEQKKIADEMYVMFENFFDKTWNYCLSPQGIKNCLGEEDFASIVPKFPEIQKKITTNEFVGIEALRLHKKYRSWLAHWFTVYWSNYWEDEKNKLLNDFDRDLSLKSYLKRKAVRRINNRLKRCINRVPLVVKREVRSIKIRRFDMEKFKKGIRTHINASLLGLEDEMKEQITSKNIKS